MTDNKRNMCQNKRVLIMSNFIERGNQIMQVSSVAKGAAVGIAAGCVTCIMSNAKHHKKAIKRHSAKKKAENAFKTVGAVMDDIAQMMQ